MEALGLAVIGGTLNGCRDTRYLSPKRLAMLRDDRWVYRERAAGVWTLTKETVGSTLLCHDIHRKVVPVFSEAIYSGYQSPQVILTWQREAPELWRREAVLRLNFAESTQAKQFGLAIHQNDHQARRRFIEWVQNEIAIVPDFHKRILLSDEAHFWLNGHVNKQNCRIRSEANPQVYVETPLHPEKLTVWCALWAGGIIGLYFFKNDEGHDVTVNGDRYRAMITNFFIPELNNHDVQMLWFQQDGATCHTANVTIDLLKDTFGDRLISRFGPVNWPPRSCDLTPLDYFL
ncbi:putative DD41D transposase [Trichonephila clavipes]|nr:putative DD41D transposase [Trichonephila clavipes]